MAKKVSEAKIKYNIMQYDKDGKFSLTNLVFPSEPYTHIVVEGKAKISIYNLRR